MRLIRPRPRLALPNHMQDGKADDLLLQGQAERRKGLERLPHQCKDVRMKVAREMTETRVEGERRKLYL